MDDVSVPVPQGPTGVTDPWPPKWMTWLILCLSVVTVFGLAIVTTLRFEDAASASSQRANSERADCRARISGEQTAIRGQQVSLLAQEMNTLVGYISSETPPKTPEEIAAARAELSQITKDLDAATKAVNTLPNIQDVVDKECPAGT